MSKSTLVILFLIWVFLVLTTPINPIVARNQYLTIPWFILIQILSIWFITRVQAYTIRKQGGE